jgi:hypothetical protein
MAQKYNSLPTGEYDDDDDSDRRGQQSLQHDRRMREQDSSLEVLFAIFQCYVELCLI